MTQQDIIEVVIIFCVGSGFNFLIIDLWVKKVNGK